MTLERPMFPPRAAAAADALKSHSPSSAPPAARPRSRPAGRFLEVDSFPDVYALELDGDCLAPLLHTGTAIVMQKSAEYGPGDVVCIWWRPHVLEAGMHECWVKQLALGAPPWVKSFPFDDALESEAIAAMQFKQFNPPGRYRVPCCDVHAIHRVIGWADAIDGHVDMDRLFPIGTPRVPTFLLQPKAG